MTFKKIFFLVTCMILQLNSFASNEPKSSYILVLGVAQDGGYPHLGCQKECCNMAWKNPRMRKNIVSLALVDPSNKKWWLFEATPDIKQQLQDFKIKTKQQYPYLPEGIFITHAHIGHYTGLIEFGREVMGTKDLKVYALPKLRSYLQENGPWSQLVELNNIKLIEIKENTPISLPSSNSVIPFTVPHRDEFSETVGFKISTNTKNYLFIPDIDKWEKWNRNIIEEVKKVDIAFLDATFQSAAELPNRAITEIPHPLVSETQNLLAQQRNAVKQKVYFIHFNHTNPLLWDKKAQNKIIKGHFNLAKQGQIFY